MHERTVTDTLLSLWRRGASSTMATLLRDTLAPLPDVQQALEVLAKRGCLIERGAGDAVTLERTGIAGWRDVIEAEGRRLGRGVGRRAMVFATTSSTNDVCWQFAGDAAAEGLVVLADEQTAGRGRRGNKWEARAGQSVLMSMRLVGTRVREGEALTLLAGLAVAEAIDAALGLGSANAAQIKWPNDVLLGGRKIAGITVETRAVGDMTAAVLGVGINVAQGATDFPPELRPRATSCYLATGRHVDRLRLVESVLEMVESRTKDGQDLWVDRWKHRCGMWGNGVKAVCNGVEVRGCVVDVDPLQGLVIRDEAGALHFLASRHTTLSA